MSTEGEPTDLKVSDILSKKIPRPQQVSSFVNALSLGLNLDSDRARVLSRFAELIFISTDMRLDFTREETLGDFKVTERGYPITQIDEEGNIKKAYIYVSKDDFEEVAMGIGKLAYNMYDEYLSTSENGKKAAILVQEYIKGLVLH